MKSANAIGAVMLLCLLAINCKASARIADGRDWSALAIKDVEAAYRILRANHPGMLDPANPNFPRVLDRARERALPLARAARDAASFSTAIQAFNAEIRDGHAGAVTALPDAETPKPRWPGFVAAYRGRSLYVYAGQPGAPPRGAKLISCDGVPANALILRNVFSLRGRPAEAGQWWSQARNLFVDRGATSIVVPSRCTFVINRAPQVYNLQWRAGDTELNRWLDQSYNGPTLPIGISVQNQGLLWIALPTFAPDAAQIELYRTMFDRLDRERALLLSTQAIVIDLRGNQGGSSDWSDQLARRIWGAPSVDSEKSRYFTGVKVRWRATIDNAQYVNRELERIQARGDFVTAANWRVIRDGMLAAHSANQPFFDEPGNATPPTSSGGAVSSVTAPVYVIVPGQCASACLDALDLFTRFPNTILLGAPSSGDSTYIDVRREALPSGIAEAIIPNKVWVGRPRKAGQIYVPRIEADDLDWTVSSFATLIRKDLYGRAQTAPKKSSMAKFPASTSRHCNAARKPIAQARHHLPSRCSAWVEARR